jgi:hypothetical protein
MKPESPIMSDKEVADLFGISVRTIRRRLSSPKTGELNLKNAVHAVVGNRRFWVRESVMALIRQPKITAK